MHCRHYQTGNQTCKTRRKSVCQLNWYWRAHLNSFVSIIPQEKMTQATILFRNLPACIAYVYSIRTRQGLHWEHVWNICFKQFSITLFPQKHSKIYCLYNIKHTYYYSILLKTINFCTLSQIFVKLIDLHSSDIFICYWLSNYTKHRP